MNYLYRFVGWQRDYGYPGSWSRGFATHDDAVSYGKARDLEAIILGFGPGRDHLTNTSSEEDGVSTVDSDFKLAEMLALIAVKAAIDSRYRIVRPRTVDIYLLSNRERPPEVTEEPLWGDDIITMVPKGVKQRKPQFESDFEFLSADGKLLMKNGKHFNAEQAWWATKLAAGDAS